MTARLGAAVGIAIGICFVTGIISHYNSHPWAWLPPPATPAGGYRFTQGLHVITGFAIIPLLLAKLWSVQHKLAQWPPARSIVHALERLSVFVLISSALLQLVTGLLNTEQYYPWKWSFVTVHYWLGYVVIGSLLLHVAVKLPIVRRGLTTSVQGPLVDGEGLTRRGALTGIGVGVGVVGLTTVGQVVGPLAKVSLLATRRVDQAPVQDFPVNGLGSFKTRQIATSTNYRLTVKGTSTHVLTIADIEALPRQTRELSIACVESWSRQATWSGPRLMDLVRMAGGNENSVVTITAVGRPYGGVLRGGPMQEALLATHLRGERLTYEHGYPVRVIAPDVKGETQIKWIGTIKVSNG